MDTWSCITTLCDISFHVSWSHHPSPLFCATVSSPSPSSPPPLTPPPSAILLSFPKDIQGIPPGVKNAAKLPSMSYFRPFITVTKLMQPLFEQGLSALQHPPTCVISDGFLGWTQESADKIGIPSTSQTICMEVVPPTMGKGGSCWLNHCSE
ncbi:hypothetical protein KY285_017670 [Solanum tuberosum]|nr:hypothetical protein KY284_017670 [Solanum tuberosum]KAH0703392.1 hypothetical protein KY285_017670 [Solanum tuberosum]